MSCAVHGKELQEHLRFADFVNTAALRTTYLVESVMASGNIGNNYATYHD